MRQAPCRIVGMICQPVHAGDILFRECGRNRLKEAAGFRHERAGVGLLCRVASEGGESRLDCGHGFRHGHIGTLELPGIENRK